MHIIQMPSGATSSEPTSCVSARRIVVPLDGTPYAERGLPSAVTLARAWNAELVLVRADVSRLSEHTRRSHPLRRQERETAHSASLYLARMEHDVRAQGVRVSSRLPVGPAAEAVLAVASACQADLVVISTHAGGGFSAPSQMSVARTLLRHADVPTLLLAYGTRSPFDRQDCSGLMVVAPLEQVSATTTALRYASLLARTFAGQVVLLSGTRTPRAAGSAPSAPGTAARTEAIRDLEGQRGHLERAQVPVWTAVVDGDVFEEAVGLAAASASILVLTAHSGAERREHTVEVALRLVQRSRLPVLVVPQRPQAHVVAGAPIDVAADKVGADVVGPTMIGAEEETHA